MPNQGSTSVTYGVGKDAGEMGEEALVNGKGTLGADSLEQAIKHTTIQVTCLVVHASHDRV